MKIDFIFYFLEKFFFAFSGEGRAHPPKYFPGEIMLTVCEIGQPNPPRALTDDRAVTRTGPSRAAAGPFVVRPIIIGIRGSSVSGDT